MKYQYTVALAICIMLCNFAVTTAFAAPPEPGTFQISLVSSTVTLGEPLILQYKVTNAEDQRVNVGIDTNDNDKWLTMKLLDSSGHPVQAYPTLTRRSHNLLPNGVGLDPNGYFYGFVVPSRTFEITQPGRYRLNVSVHMTYSLDNNSSEQSLDDQNLSFPVTVTAKDPQRLHAVAEGFRQTVLHEPGVGKSQTALQALFAMRDPDCLPVWRELATDPKLDASWAVVVIKELAKVGSVSASDILAEMQPIAPERWSQTGTSPLDVLAAMWFNATPELKQHINQLMVKAGEPPVTEHTKLVGAVN